MTSTLLARKQLALNISVIESAQIKASVTETAQVSKKCLE